MKIIFNPLVLQKNNIKDKKTAFKAAKNISTEKLERIIAEKVALPEALKANFIMGNIKLNTPKHLLTQKFCKMYSELAPVQKKTQTRVHDTIYNINDENVEFLNEIEPRFRNFEIMEAFAKFSNSKSIPFFKSFIELDCNSDNKNDSYIAKLDYLNFVANNIEDSEFNESLFRLTRTLEPIVLPLTKHLTNVLKKDYDKSKSYLRQYKDAFLHNAELEAYLYGLNQKDLDTNTFLQLLELIRFRKSFSEPDAIGNILDNSSINDVDIADARAEVYEKYAKIKINREKMPKYMEEKYKKFIKETSDYLKKYGDNIHPLMLCAFISHIGPNNFEAVEYLSSNYCSIDDLKTRTTLINTLDSDVDCSEFLDLFFSMQMQGLNNDSIISLTKAYVKTLKYLSHEEKKEIIQKIIDLRKKVEANPEKYQGNHSNTSVNMIFNLYCDELAKTMYVYDSNVIEDLFSRRLNNVEAFLNSFTASPRNLDLLKDLTYCISPDGKSLTTTEKLNLARIVSAFEESDMKKLENMAIDGVVDLIALKKDYFHKILNFLDFKSEEINSIPKEKFESWDTTYLPMLIQASRSNSDSFSELFRACLTDDFMKYIHNDENEIGKCNLQTKAIFEEKGLNYEKWVKPKKENEVQIKLVDQNRKRLERNVQELMENISTLRKSPVKIFFDKRFPEYIKGDIFELPNSIAQSAEKLELFVKNLIVQMEPAWKRAKSNLENRDCEAKIYEQATNTLTIKDHLLEIQNEILKFKDMDFDRNLDLTIKMWDRIPEKDLFQGNYSTCCIALDRTNGHVMPDYLLNTSLNMIEIVDNSTGQVAGNALCYIAKNEEGEPSFIIDNIEIGNKYKLSGESSMQLFGAIKKYIANICKDISEKEMPVYMGRNFNDLNPHSATVNQNLDFLGNINACRIYLDVYGGWISSKKLNNKLILYKI